MSLRDHKPVSLIGATCSTCTLVESMPADEAAALNEMFADPRWTALAISDALRAEGYTEAPGASAIGRHLRGQCKAAVKHR